MPHDPSDDLPPTPAADDVLRACPEDAEPSPVPGLSRGEYDELADNLRWFGPLPLDVKLRTIAKHIRAARRRGLSPKDETADGT